MASPSDAAGLPRGPVSSVKEAPSRRPTYDPSIFPSVESGGRFRTGGSPAAPEACRPLFCCQMIYQHSEFHRFEFEALCEVYGLPLELLPEYYPPLLFFRLKEGYHLVVDREKCLENRIWNFLGEANRGVSQADASSASVQSGPGEGGGPSCLEKSCLPSYAATRAAHNPRAPPFIDAEKGLSIGLPVRDSALGVGSKESSAPCTKCVPGESTPVLLSWLNDVIPQLVLFSHWGIVIACAETLREMFSLCASVLDPQKPEVPSEEFGRSELPCPPAPYPRYVIPPDVYSRIVGELRPANYRFTYSTLGQTVQTPEQISMVENYTGALGIFAPCCLRFPDVNYHAISDVMGLRERDNEAYLHYAPRCCLLLNCHYTHRSTTSYRCRLPTFDAPSFKLPERRYLGPTSMNSLLAMLMCECARVRPGSWVLDPFAGTCSVLIGATYFGGVCFAGEMDIKVLAGKGGVTFRDNFAQYALVKPDMVQADVFKPVFASSMFDAMVCDPPYAIRCSTKEQELSDVFLETVRLASSVLKVGGYLGFWLPCIYELFDPELDVPVCPSMTLIGCPLQRLTGKYGRRYVLMRKTAEPGDPDKGEVRYPRGRPSHADLRAYVRGLQEGDGGEMGEMQDCVTESSTGADNKPAGKPDEGA